MGAEEVETPASSKQLGGEITEEDRELNEKSEA